MSKLSDLLHELIDHAVPMGNRRGELHALVDAATAPAGAPAGDAPADPAPKSAVPPVKLAAPSDGAEQA